MPVQEKKLGLGWINATVGADSPVWKKESIVSFE
jgi:hypothetical protein